VPTGMRERANQKARASRMFGVTLPQPLMHDPRGASISAGWANGESADSVATMRVRRRWSL